MCQRFPSITSILLREGAFRGAAGGVKWGVDVGHARPHSDGPPLKAQPMTHVSAWSQTEKPDSIISLISSAGFHHGLDSSMMPCSISCSRVLRCCRQSWRTVREQRHGGQGGGCHHPKPNPLSHLAAICGFNRQTCQASDSTKYLLSPDQSATSKRPDGKPRHRHPIHFLRGCHKLYNSWTSI